MYIHFHGFSLYIAIMSPVYKLVAEVARPTSVSKLKLDDTCNLSLSQQASCALHLFLELRLLYTYLLSQRLTVHPDTSRSMLRYPVFSKYL